MHEQLKRDALGTLAGIVIIAILLNALFPDSGIATIAKLLGGIIWLFVLPGYFIMLPLRETLELKERIVVGMLAVAGLEAIASYYAGIAGLHIRSHSWLFPALIIIAGIALAHSKRFMNRAKASAPQ